MSPALVTTPQGQRYVVERDEVANILQPGMHFVIGGVERGFSFQAHGPQVPENHPDEFLTNEGGYVKRRILQLPDGTIIKPCLADSKQILDHLKG